METLIEFINIVGFPSLMCLLMYKRQEKSDQIILELTSTLKTIDTRIENLEDRLK